MEDTSYSVLTIFQTIFKLSKNRKKTTMRQQFTYKAVGYMSRVYVLRRHLLTREIVFLITRMLIFSKI